MNYLVRALVYPLAVAVAGQALLAQNGSEPREGFIDAEVAGVGVDPSADSPVVLLEEQGQGRLLPIWVGFPEARAIALALEGVATPRPMTHDLMRSIVESSNLKVECVQVDALQSSTYFAKVIGKKMLPDGSVGEDFEIDSRPSDAMALALRLRVPIHVSETLLMAIPDFDFAPGNHGGRVRALGLDIQRPDAKLLAAAGLKEDGPGLVVLKLGENAPQGLEVGDILLEAEGQPLMSVADLVQLLRGKSTETLVLKVQREEEVVEVTVPTQPRAPARAPEGFQA